MTAPLLTDVLAADGEAAHDPDQLPRRLEDCWDEPEVSAHAPWTAHDELQGAWFSFSGRREAEFLISGNRFTIRFADGDIYMGVFELHPSALPRRMAMRVDEGPARHKGKTAWCIYEVDGRSLRWCAVSPGQADRLPAFPAEDDPQYLCLRFRREQAV